MRTKYDTSRFWWGFRVSSNSHGAMGHIAGFAYLLIHVTSKQAMNHLITEDGAFFRLGNDSIIEY